MAKVITLIVENDEQAKQVFTDIGKSFVTKEFDFPKLNISDLQNSTPDEGRTEARTKEYFDDPDFCSNCGHVHRSGNC